MLMNVPFSKHLLQGMQQIIECFPETSVIFFFEPTNIFVKIMVTTVSALY
jgi:hypothetical protein